MFVRIQASTQMFLQYQRQLFLRCTDADAIMRGHQWKRRLAGREQWRAINS